MSLPDSNDHLADGPPLSRQQQFAFDHLHMLSDIAQDAEQFLAPFLNPRIVESLLKMRRLFDDANKLLMWGELDRVDHRCQQIQGTLIELRSLGKELGFKFFDRVIPIP